MAVPFERGKKPAGCDTRFCGIRHARDLCRYCRQRERIAGWILDALHGELDPTAARHIASLMLATADGMLVQSFIDPQEVPRSRELAGAMGKALAAASRPGT